jgi:DNA-binding transcriptional regulator PaaX
MHQRPRHKLLPLRNIILRTLATAGVMGVAVIAPNTLSLIKHFDRAAVRRKHLYANINQALFRLHAAGLVELSGDRGRRKARLTAAGEKAVEAVYTHEYAIPEPAFWDGKWRLIIFDVREGRRRIRNRLRLMLQGAGFMRLQDSVWIYPYPCDEFVQLVRAHLSSGTGEMLHFTADALEADRKLRDHFNLM